MCCDKLRLNHARSTRSGSLAASCAVSRALLMLAIVLTTHATHSTAAAQDPFGADPMPAAPMPGAGDPFGAGGTAPKPTTPKLDESPVEEPAVIQQLRESKPETATKLLEAAHATLLFGRPDESKRYLAQLLAAKLPEAQFAEASSIVGSAALIRLSTDPAVQPEGKQAADMAFAAGYKAKTDPAVIAAMIPLLRSESPVDQKRALTRLADAGPEVVAPLLSWIADPSKKDDVKFVRGALARLGQETEEPLLAALDHPSPEVREQVVLALGMMKSQRAVPYFVGIVASDSKSPTGLAAAACLRRIIGTEPGARQAAIFLRQTIDQLYAGIFPLKADPDGNVPIWTWDVAAKAPKLTRIPRGDAALQLASRLAADLSALEPSSADATQLKLLAGLEQLKIAGGIDQPLDMGSPLAKEALSLDTSLVDQTLVDAMHKNRPLAAIACVEILAKHGETSLQTSGGSRRPLAEALTHTDRRLRLWATLAILEMQPQQRFAGSSYFVLGLDELLATTGDRRILIAHPRATEGQSLVGFMRELGFEAESVTHGKQVIETAVNSPDFEMLLLSTTIDGPPVMELVQLLRRDYRTAGLPIGVLARNEELELLRERLAGDPLVHVMPRIHEVGDSSFEINRMIERMGRSYVSRDERMQLARRAAKGLAPMFASKSAIERYDLVRLESSLIDAITRSTLSSQATDLLGILATPKAQLALVEYASEPLHSTAARQRAATAFAKAREHRGLLLTSSRILTQFELYNASEALDRDTQLILSSILDSIERTGVTPTSAPAAGVPAAK